MTLQKISLNHEACKSPFDQYSNDHSGRMTNHGHMYARGNGATEKGSPNMHSIFKIYLIKSPPILIRHLLPLSSIKGEVVVIGVDGSLEKPKRSGQKLAKEEIKGLMARIEKLYDI